MAYAGSAGHVAHSVDLLDMWLTLWICWIHESLCGYIGHVAHSGFVGHVAHAVDILDMWITLWVC